VTRKQYPMGLIKDLEPKPRGRPRKNPNELAVDARERIPGSISHAEMAQLREVATAAAVARFLESL